MIRYFKAYKVKMVENLKEEHAVNGENGVQNGVKGVTNGENGVVKGNSYPFNYDEDEYLRLTKRILETG